MQINWIEGTNYSSAPSWLTGAGGVLDQVQSFYDRLFTNNITIDVTINWVPLGDTHNGGILAENNLNGGPGGVTSSFSTISAALVSHARYATQNDAYSNMPSGVGNVYVTPGDAMVLGLESKQTVDIWVDVASDGYWVQDGGIFDPFAAIAHEITETAMGRFSNPSTTPDLMDMFRFSAPGVHDLSSGTSSSNTTAYFSIDDGTTNLGTWNNKPNNGDYGDWTAGPIPNDAYGSQNGSPVAPVSEVDIELMNVLGWSTDIVTSGNTLSVTGGKTFSGYTAMAGGEVLVQSGGTTSNFTYTDAQQFNDGVLAPGSSGGVGAFVFIESGGYEAAATLDAGGYEWIDSGGEAQYTTVNSSGTILAFGLAEDAVVSAEGLLNVESGGSGYYNSVLAGGTLSVFSGGLGFGDHIEDGGTEIVLGTVELDTVSAGAIQTISSGGLSDVSFIDGAQYVYGVASGDIVSGAPANQYVEYGGSAVSAVLSAYGFQYVMGGGYASATTVSATTEQIVESGGEAAATTVLSGGTENLAAGAVGAALTVSAGGFLGGAGVLIDYNSVAGTVSGVTVGDATHIDELELLSGGVASNVTVTIASDYLQVDSGASATGTVLMSNGYDVVYGSTASTTMSSGGTEYVSSGGETTDATVLSGGTESLAAGAVGAALTVSAGGFLGGPGVLIDYNSVAGTVSGVTVGDATHVDELELLSGGVASNVTVTIGSDVLQVDSGASATGTVLMSNGYDVVYGSASSTTVSSGGTEYVSSGGKTTNATVLSGGTENLAAGAVGDDLTVSAGAVLDGPGALIGANSVFGAANGVTVGGGATETVYAGGLASGTKLLGGGREIISAAGRGVGATVSSGGVEYVLAAGTATGTVVSSGGYQFVSSGGVASATRVLSGGRQYVSSGGHASATIVNGGGAQIVRSAGTASATVIVSGGQEIVSSGGVASGTKVLSGGRDYVLAGGHAVGATVFSGGVENVRASGSILGTVIGSGGEAFVSSGGVASGTTVLSGGRDYLLSGGFAVGLGVRSGGVLVDDGEVLIAGAATLAGTLAGSGAVVETGGGDLVIGGAGAGFDGRATIRGGTIELATAGALGSGYVQFVEPSSGSAVLRIDAADAPAAGGTFANTISNFNGAHEDIDLRSIAFVAGASATVSGSTLVLTDGGKTYKFKLAGAVAGAYPVLSDGHGGTLIDPEAASASKPADPRVLAFAHTLAAFAPADAANTALVSSTSRVGPTSLVHAAEFASAGRY